jgi:hypothetical protein
MVQAPARPGNQPNAESRQYHPYARGGGGRPTPRWVLRPLIGCVGWGLLRGCLLLLHILMRARYRGRPAQDGEADPFDPGAYGDAAPCVFALCLACCTQSFGTDTHRTIPSTHTHTHTHTRMRTHVHMVFFSLFLRAVRHPSTHALFSTVPEAAALAWARPTDTPCAAPRFNLYLHAAASLCCVLSRCPSILHGGRQYMSCLSPRTCSMQHQRPHACDMQSLSSPALHANIGCYMWLISSSWSRDSECGAPSPGCTPAWARNRSNVFSAEMMPCPLSFVAPVYVGVSERARMDCDHWSAVCRRRPPPTIMCRWPLKAQSLVSKAA